MFGEKITLVRANVNRLIVFTLLNLVLCLLISGRFFNGLDLSIDSLLSLGLMFFANLLMFHLLMSLILLIPNRIFYKSKFVWFFNFITFYSFDIYWFFDGYTYELYRYHINGLVLNLLMAESASDSVEMSSSLVFSILIPLLILLFSLLFFLWISFRWKSKFSGYKSFLKPYIYAMIFFILSDKFSYAYYDLFNKSAYLRYAKVAPLYQRFTVKSALRDLFGYKLDKEEGIDLSTGNSLLDYPNVEEWSIDKNDSLPNVVLILVESMRWDMLDSVISPTMYQFANEEALSFENHYSGGNASRFGIFSLLYGIHATYWHNILGERRSSIMMDYMQSTGYDFKILSSTKLTFPEFRKTAFVRLPEYINDTLPGKYNWQRDMVQIGEFDQWLEEGRDTTKPYFSFLYLDAPHANYSHPKNHEIFTPVSEPDKVNQMDFSGVTDNTPYLNMYKNAIHATDSVIAEFLHSLKGQKDWDNTIVLITGDHGEEFGELGYWGHTGNFGEYQTRTPFVLRVPGKLAKKIDKRSSHTDFVPTIMSLMNCKEPLRDYSNGRDLLGEEGVEPYLVSAGWDDAAMLYEDYTIVFSTETYNSSPLEVRDLKYKLLPEEEQQKVLNKRRKDLNDLMKSMNRFSK